MDGKHKHLDTLSGVINCEQMAHPADAWVYYDVQGSDGQDYTVVFRAVAVERRGEDGFIAEKWGPTVTPTLSERPAALA